MVDTQFKKGRVMRVNSPQLVFVNGIPRHIKDLRSHQRSISSEDNSSDKSSESDSSTLLLFRAESDESPAESEEIVLENDEDDAEDERELVDTNKEINKPHSTL